MPSDPQGAQGLMGGGSWPALEGGVSPLWVGTRPLGCGPKAAASFLMSWLPAPWGRSLLGWELEPGGSCGAEAV